MQASTNDVLCSLHDPFSQLNKNLFHSYYGDSADPNVNRRYLSQIRERASDVASKYPGWTMRVYYDGAEDDFDAVSEMCDIWCAADHVDFCDVNALPRPFGNLKSLMPVGELGDQTPSIS